MRHQLTTPIFHRLTALLCLSAAAGIASAETVWQNDWTYQAPPAFSRHVAGYTSVDFAADGAVVIGGVNQSLAEFQTSRLGNDGSVRWSANFDYFGSGDYYASSALVADDDGGAFVSLAESYPPKIARFDASGNLSWTRHALAKRLVKLPGTRLAAFNCSELIVLDGSNGDVLWRKGIPRPSSCSPSDEDVLSDGTGTIYLSYVANGTLVSIRLNPDGTQAGTLATIPTGGLNAYVIGLAGAHIYYQIGSELRSYQLSDGMLSWAVDIGAGNGATLSADANPEPIVIGSSVIQRLRAANGSLIWGRAFSNISLFSVVQGAVVFRADENLVKLDSGTGATAWTSSLPNVDASGHTIVWQRLGGLANNTLTGVGNLNYGPGVVLPKLVLQPIDFSNGALLTEASVQDVSQGLLGTSVADGNQAVSAAFALTPFASQLRVRSVDTASGSTQWESTRDIPLGSQGFSTIYTPDVAVGDSAIAVVSTLTLPAFPNSPYGALQIDLFDRATGSAVWSSQLHEVEQGESRTWGPKLDADGNVYVDIETSIPCGFDSRCGYHRLYKLSKLDGAVLWSRDDARGNYEIFGNDVLMPSSSFDATASLRRLSGTDGSEIWATSELTGDVAGSGTYGLIRLDDQHVNLLGSMHNAKINVASGATVWSVVNQPYNCAPTCSVNDGIILSNGDLFQVGEGGSVPYLRRVHNDGSGTVEEWHPSGNPALLRSNLTRIWKAPSGDLQVTLAQTLRSTGVYLGFIAHLDPVNGNLSGFQSRGAFPVDEGSSGSLFSFMDAPSENEVLYGSLRQSPTLPTTTSTGLFDTTVTTHGDLVASLSLDDDNPSAGGSLGFHLTVSYSGDQALVGAHLIASLPGHGSAGPLDCSVMSAGNCVTDARFGGINASFDIQPGGSVTISGELLDLESAEQGWIGVGTYGPTSLSEPDTINNLARAAVIQSLFRDGFEP